MIDRLLLAEQAYFDPLVFDTKYKSLTEREQKVRHIAHHVSKAVLKVSRGLSEVDDPDLPEAARIGIKAVKTEVMPDAAIYRSQLINLFPDLATRELLLKNLPEFKDTPDEDQAKIHDQVSTFEGAHIHLADAAGYLAEYIEPIEHTGLQERNPMNGIGVAISELHFTANMLAVHFDLDMVKAQRDRMEQLLGGPLPKDLD